MHSVQRRKRLQRIEDRCRQRGLALTVQRRVILEALLDRTDHPTADRIFDEVKERVAGISRTTVYRVLETLARVGIITKVCHVGTGVRFDPKTERHHHLVCLQCHKVIDLEDGRLDALPMPAVRPRGFEISDFSIYFRGVCRECRTRSAATGRAAGQRSKRPKPGAAKPRTKTRSPKRRR
jgi:Fur family peroxide stress response transcriptional regulator